MLEVCFSAHPNIQYRTVFCCPLFCGRDWQAEKKPDTAQKKDTACRYDRDNVFFRDMFCFIKLFLQGLNVSRKYIRTFSGFHH